MKNINDQKTIDFYLSDDYIKQNPSLHEEDSIWKTQKIKPLLNKYLELHPDKKNIILDVGGGAGVILKIVSDYIVEQNENDVIKITLDLSPGMLAIQNKTNPDLAKSLNEDLRKTSLNNKEIDLTLLIDVLEHIPDPAEALKEVKRISKYTILKVPLEDNLINRLWNFATRGKLRELTIKNVGHINIYNFKKLKKEIELNTGKIIDYYYTNVFDYFCTAEHYQNKINTIMKLLNFIARYLFKISPRLCSIIFNDFVVMLIKCY